MRHQKTWKVKVMTFVLLLLPLYHLNPAFMIDTLRRQYIYQILSEAVVKGCSQIFAFGYL